MPYAYNNLYTETLRSSTFSMERSDFIGVAPSSNIIGGLQQVYSVDNFTFDYSGVDIGEIVQKESNSIPIYYSPGGTEEGEETCIDMGAGLPPLCLPGETITTADRLILNNDGFSSGRLKNGTIVYCYEKQQAYQFLIDNYNTLYDAAAAQSSHFTSTQYNFTVLSGTTATDNFISAWINHKVEGELKAPLDPSQGVWSRDEANWKKYPNEEEYFAINNVPASELIDDFNFEDAIIVVPPSWNNKKVLSATSSIFTMASNVESTITLNHITKEGAKTTKDWTHSASSKNATGDFSSAPLTLVEGATLHLSQSSNFGAGNFGYTATFKVKG